ncbi:hypothetical protein [Fimbriimonas ginsengisoli]|nr:hypothetical protein [Fimbriimonas ginsengisoli]
MLSLAVLAALTLSPQELSNQSFLQGLPKPAAKELERRRDLIEKRHGSALKNVLEATEKFAADFSKQPRISESLSTLNREFGDLAKDEKLKPADRAKRLEDSAQRFAGVAGSALETHIFGNLQNLAKSLDVKTPLKRRPSGGFVSTSGSSADRPSLPPQTTLTSHGPYELSTSYERTYGASIARNQTLLLADPRGIFMANVGADSIVLGAGGRSATCILGHSFDIPAGYSRGEATVYLHGNAQMAVFAGLGGASAVTSIGTIVTDRGLVLGSTQRDVATYVAPFAYYVRGSEPLPTAQTIIFAAPPGGGPISVTFNIIAYTGAGSAIGSAYATADILGSVDRIEVRLQR